MDECSEQTIVGWGWDSATPDRPISIEIYDGPVLVAQLLANLFRPDLLAAGYGDGRHAFHYALPMALRDGRLHTVSVTFTDPQIHLQHSPCQVVWGHAEKYTDRLGAALGDLLSKPAWNIDSVLMAERFIEIYGWALPPKDGRQGTFKLNGSRFDLVDYPYKNRPNVAKLFWYWPNSEFSGFRCRSDISPDDLFATGQAVVEFADEETGRAFCPQQNFYWPPQICTLEGLPDDDSMLRVSGHCRKDSFVQDGYTTFVKLGQVLQGTVGRWPAGNTLDWGCGCGRVTRWIIDKDLPDVHVTGVDIDPQNLTWCNAHLPGATFEHIPLHPPTHFADGEFSVILGMSVFSHLDESTQLEWLAELRRIASPNAILLMSIHSAASVARSLPTEQWISDWAARGFDAGYIDRSLDQVVGETTYYRAAYHTAGYIQQIWAQYFEVVAIIPAFLSNEQDLVVLRRR